MAVLNSRIFKSWEWKKSLEERDISALHLVDDTFSWYHNCLDDARELLDKYKPVRLVGVSMGGYAALLLGSLHGIHAKVFGAQTTLVAPWDQRWATEWVKVQETTKHPQYLDLKDMQVSADAYYCEGSPEDVRHAKRMNLNHIPRGCLKHEDSGRNLNHSEIFDI